MNPRSAHMRPAPLRIHRVSLHPWRLTLRRPLHTAHGTLRLREGILCALHAGDYVGFGEASPLPGFGMESLAACRQALQVAANKLRGAPLSQGMTLLPQGVTSLPQDPAALATQQPLWASAEWALPSHETPGARNAVETALLDVLAQQAGLPLAHFLCAAARSSLPVNALCPMESPEDAPKHALERVAAGFACLKYKVGLRTAAREFQMLAAVRAAVGAQVQIRADANGAWSALQAEEILCAWAPLALEYVEQPLAQQAWAAAPDLQHRVPVPLAADESACNEAAALHALTLAQTIVLKPQALGGPLTTLRVAQAAQRAGRKVVITTMLEGLHGRFGVIHTAAAALAPTELARAIGGNESEPGAENSRSAVLPACGLATGDLFAENAAHADEIPREGRIWLANRPGLGLPPPG